MPMVQRGLPSLKNYIYTISVIDLHGNLLPT
jgi:hypothetical protein